MREISTWVNLCHLEEENRPSDLMIDSRLREGDFTETAKDLNRKECIEATILACIQDRFDQPDTPFFVH